MKILMLSLILMSLGKFGRAFDRYDDNNDLSRSNRCFSDTNSIKRKLPMYHAILCIDNLLKQVVKANHPFYDKKKYYYSLSFKKEKDKRYLIIESVQYKSSRAFDHIGAIKVADAIFLCRGDISIDTLFRLNSKEFLNVYLKRKPTSEDFNYGFEPSLRGVYQECNEIKISLEIYARATLPGYRMEEQKSKN